MTRRLLLLALLAPLAACGDDEPASFCELATQEVEEDYVGSDDHVDDLGRMVATAPDEVRDDVRVIRDHISREVDPDVPESNEIAGYPAEVRAAIERVQAHASDSC